MGKQSKIALFKVLFWTREMHRHLSFYFDFCLTTLERHLIHFCSTLQNIRTKYIYYKVIKKTNSFICISTKYVYVNR